MGQEDGTSSVTWKWPDRPRERAAGLLERPSEWTEAQFQMGLSGDRGLKEVHPHVPAKWYRHPYSAKSVWVAAFQTAGINLEESPGFLHIDFLNARAVLGHGSLTFLDSSDVVITYRPDGRPELINEPTLSRTEPGGYLLVLMPVSDEFQGDDVDATAYRQRTESVTGALIALVGRDVAHELLFESLMGLTTKGVANFTRQIEIPGWSGQPDLDTENLATIRDASGALSQLEREEQYRFALSLRWFYQSFGNVEVDAFLRLWISLETLASGANGIRTTLARAYGLDREQAGQEFHIGRFEGIRDRIVHDGEDFPVSSSMLLYLRAVYADVLRCVLNLRFRGEARNALEGRASGVIDYVSQKSKRRKASS